MINKAKILFNTTRIITQFKRSGIQIKAHIIQFSITNETPSYVPSFSKSIKNLSRIHFRIMIETIVAICFKFRKRIDILWICCIDDLLNRVGGKCYS